MKIDQTTVEKLGKLAKLKFNDEESKAIQSDMTKILDFIDKLSELDTDSVDEMEYVNPSENVLRADDVKGSVSKEDALKNGPVTDSDFFKVPKVIKK